MSEYDDGQLGKDIDAINLLTTAMITSVSGLILILLIIWMCT